MPKYNFSVTTRDGQKVDNIQIFGQDLADAERKLNKMYLHCQIGCHNRIDSNKNFFQSADIEDVLSLIVKQD